MLRIPGLILVKLVHNFTIFNYNSFMKDKLNYMNFVLSDLLNTVHFFNCIKFLDIIYSTINPFMHMRTPYEDQFKLY